MSTLQIQTPRAFLPFLKAARYKGAHGGRGSGKSHFFAEALVERAMLNPGHRAVCIREVQRSLKESVKRLVEDKIIALGVGRVFDVQRELIGTPGGGVIVFQGMQNHTAESIKSLEGYDLGWVEEAQSLSQRSLDLLRPTIRKDASELWFSWNPNDEKDPVDALLRGSDVPPGAIVREVNFADNPWFPDVLRQEMEFDRRRDPDKYAHVWLGGYNRKSQARVFKNWRIARFETPPGVRFYFGGDWGFSVDPTVLVRCFIDGRTLFVDREAYKVGCEIDDTPALFAGDCPSALRNQRGDPLWENRYGHSGIAGARQWPIRADSARPETISYMQRHGFQNLVAANKGPGSIEDGIEFLQSFDIVVHEDCTHTSDELASFSYKTDKLTGEVLPVLEDKKNHVIDSLRYALEGARPQGHSFAYA